MGISNLNNTGIMDFQTVVNELQNALANDARIRNRFWYGTQNDNYMWIGHPDRVIGNQVCHYELKRYNQNNRVYCSIEVHYQDNNYQRFWNIINSYPCYDENSTKRDGLYLIDVNRYVLADGDNIRKKNVIVGGKYTLDTPKLVEILLNHLIYVDGKIGSELRIIAY